MVRIARRLQQPGVERCSRGQRLLSRRQAGRDNALKSLVAQQLGSQTHRLCQTLLVVRVLQAVILNSRAASPRALVDVGVICKSLRASEPLAVQRRLT